MSGRCNSVLDYQEKEKTMAEDSSSSNPPSIDKNDLADMLNAYEENAKVIEEDKDEEGTNLRVFKNKYVKMALLIFSVGLALYHVYALLIKLANPLVFYSIHWGMGLFLVFLYYPIKKDMKSKKLPFYDAALILLVLVVVAYVLLQPDDLMYRAARNSSTTVDLVIGTIAMILSLEAARRTIGLGLPIVALVFVAYAFWGNHLPSLIACKGYSFKRVIGFIFSVEGIFGSPIKMSAQYVFLLIIFGAFLGVSGAGEFFMKFAMKLAGSSRGGPAKVAVISSGLFGSISGSAVANVVGTGVFTIPLMKKTGYKPHFAGAVEAVASTGGQIMPPVMGSGAFIMAELLGMNYTNIALGALIPALLYYLSLIVMVDLEAARTGLNGVDTSEIPKARVLLKEGWNLLLPLVVLIYFLVVARATVSRAAVWAIVAAIAGCALKKSSRMSFMQILQAIEIDYIDESEVLSPADDKYHIDKTKFDVPFVCGAKDLGEALRRINEGASMIRTKGEPGTGDIVQAVRHMRRMQAEIRRISAMAEDELFDIAKQLQVPYDLVLYVHEHKKLPVVNFAAGGVATPADAALMMQLGAEGVFVGSGIFKSGNPEKRAAAIVKAVTNFTDAKMLAELSEDLGEAMVGINEQEIELLMAERGK